MKRSINYHQFGLSLLLILFVSCAEKGEKQDQGIPAIKEAASKLIPDKRVEVFDLDIQEIKGDYPGYLLSGAVTSKETKRRFLQRLDSLQLKGRMVDSIMVLPDPALGENTWALVNVSVCNIRTKPGHSQELTTQAEMGTPVRVLQKDGSWYRIQTPDRYIAWVDEAAIHRLNPDELNHWKGAKRMVFTKDLGFVRSMTIADQVVSDLTLGCILEVSGSKGSDILVTLPDGRTGWVNASALIPFEDYENQAYPNFPSLFSLAETFMGRPYLWGGTSPRGVDCSGYMKTLFLMNGVILSRDANQQVLHGEEISLDNDLKALRPGDLLFFGRKATENRNEQVSHVGLYLGEGKFIHSSGRVKVNSLRANDIDYSEYLRSILLHARRITQADLENGPWTIKNHPWYNL